MTEPINLFRILSVLILCLIMSANDPAHAQETVLKKKQSGYWIEEYQVLKSDTSIRHGTYLLKTATFPWVKGRYENGKKVGKWERMAGAKKIQVYNFDSHTLEIADDPGLNYELTTVTGPDDYIVPPVAILPVQYIFMDAVSSFSRKPGSTQMKILIGTDENDRVISLDVISMSVKKTETKSFEVKDSQRDHILSARVNGKAVKTMIVFSVMVNVQQTIRRF